MLWKLLAVPIASVVALGVHLGISKSQPVSESRLYSVFLCIVLVFALAGAVAQPFWASLKRWMAQLCPIIAAAVFALAAWETITTGLHWLPLPYFPGPAAVLQSLVNDRRLLFDSTWHSLILLLGGYALGVAIALVTGVCIGWFSLARYWGMPLLKVVGPIPATAWIPLAMVISPSAVLSAVGLIALTVWFPVPMLTASDVSNTRASYIDVALTLGPNQRYLIFRVALPASLPHILIGLCIRL